MAKSFKLKLSKVINSTLQSCRSTDPSDLPEEPTPFPPLFRLSPNSKLVTVDFPVNQLPSRMKYVDAAGNLNHPVLRRLSSSSDPTISSTFIRSFSSTSREFKWETEEKWHVIAKIYDQAHSVPCRNRGCSRSSNTKNVKRLALPPPIPVAPPLSSSISRPRRKKRQEKSKKIPVINDFSAEFSNVGDERSEEVAEKTIVANFYIDSSSMEFAGNNQNRSSSSKRRYKMSKKKPKKRSTSTTTTTHSIEIIHRQSSVSSTAAEIGGSSSPARLSMFKNWIPCSVDGKMKESFAFVTKSEDPYEDFKRSMMEMILEKQIFEQEELGKLLQCFLALNSTQYHILIFKAFSEISDAMFSGSSRNSIHHHRCASASSSSRS